MGHVEKRLLPHPVGLELCIRWLGLRLVSLLVGCRRVFHGENLLGFDDEQSREYTLLARLPLGFRRR